MKLIIPAGGRGTRLLPATKSVAKEMLPLTDRPLLQYLIEEGIKSNVSEIIIIRSPGKKGMESHFRRDKKLEKALGEKKQSLLQSILHIHSNTNLKFAVQKKPRGDGNALLCAKKKIGKDDFAVVFGDTLFDSKIPVLSQMMKVYKKTGKSVVGVKAVPRKDVSRYGIVKVVEKNKLLQVKKIVEKPNPKQAPSNLALTGIYIISSSIWKYLNKSNYGKDGELRLADGLKQLLKHDDIYAYKIKDEWLDTGNYVGYLKANIRIAKKHPEFGKEIKRILREEVGK